MMKTMSSTLFPFPSVLSVLFARARRRDVMGPAFAGAVSLLGYGSIQRKNSIASFLIFFPIATSNASHSSRVSSRPAASSSR